MKHKIGACMLVFAMIISIMTPVAYATEVESTKNSSLGNAVECEEYTLFGAETDDVRYNIMVNRNEGTGQFAIVYLDSPDYMYEYVFDVDDIYSDPSNIVWEDLYSSCLANTNSWSEVYLPTAVIVDESVIEPYALNDSNEDEAIRDFEEFLTYRYGDEYVGRLTSTKTQNGLQMYLKTALQLSANRDRSYYIRTTMTVVGFVTGMLGLAAGSSAVTAIGLIASADGMLHLGQSVYEYEVRANWSRYVTLVSGSGYPYGMVNKFITYKGYMSTETGSHTVDAKSETTSYAPSREAFNAYDQIYENAYSEYLMIGWQEGNF